MEQAKALGYSSQWGENNIKFWKIYSSDLPRAKHTTGVLLQSLRDSGRISVEAPIASMLALEGGVLFDARLRELAKGARQGLPKDLSYETALQMRQLQIAAGEMSADDPIPLLETEDDGWNRAEEWLVEVVWDALQQNRQPEDGECWNVLVVAHAGLLRVFLKRFLGEERLRAHPDATFDPIDGRFAVPNTSLTILTLSCSTDDESPADTARRGVSSIDNIDITLLTSTQHYQSNVREESKTR